MVKKMLFIPSDILSLLSITPLRRSKIEIAAMSFDTKKLVRTRELITLWNLIPAVLVHNYLSVVEIFDELTNGIETSLPVNLIMDISYFYNY